MHTSRNVLLMSRATNCRSLRAVRCLSWVKMKSMRLSLGMCPCAFRFIGTVGGISFTAASGVCRSGSYSQLIVSSRWLKATRVLRAGAQAVCAAHALLLLHGPRV